jgi:hypothetical protein
VAKPTLGRGLGELLGSNRTSAEPSAPVRPPGVGLRILIDGSQKESESVTKPSTELERAGVSSVRHIQAASDAKSNPEDLTRALAVFTLAGADLALLGWPTYQVMAHPNGLSGTALTFCAVSVLLGASCACAAAALARRK